MDTFLLIVGRLAALLALPVGVALVLFGLIVGIVVPGVVDAGTYTAGLDAQPGFYAAVAPDVIPALVEQASGLTIPAAADPAAPVTAADLDAAVRGLNEAADQLAAGELADDARAALLTQLIADAQTIVAAANPSDPALAANAAALADTARTLPDATLIDTAREIAAAAGDLTPPDSPPPSTVPAPTADLLAAFQPEAWAVAARQAISQDWLRSQVSAAVEGGLNGQIVPLDTAPLQAALTGDSGRQLAVQLVALARPCTSAELAALNAASAAATLPVCNPGAGEASGALVQTAIMDVLAEAARSLAAEANPFALAVLHSPLVITAQAGTDLAPWLRGVGGPPLPTAADARSLSIALAMVPLGILALLVLVGTRDLRLLAYWGGAVLALGGALTLIGLSLASGEIDGLATLAASGLDAPYTRTLQADLLHALLNGLRLELQQPLQNQATILLIVGGILLFLGAFARRLLPIEEID